MTKIPLTHANIINILGIESLPLKERQAIVEESVELIETRAFNSAMDKLDEAGQTELVTALEKNDQDAALAVLNKANVNLVEIIEAEAEKLKQEMVKLSKV